MTLIPTVSNQHVTVVVQKTSPNSVGFSGKINCIEAFVSTSNGINVNDVIIGTPPSQSESTFEEDVVKQPIQYYNP